MLNLAEPKNLWNDMADESPSESPGGHGHDGLTTASLVSRMGLKLAQRKGQDSGKDKTSSSTNQRVDDLQHAEGQTTSAKDSNADDDGIEQTRNLVRPSALAARRHLQPPPRNVNVASHLSPLHHQTPAEGETTGPLPLPSSTGAARTPMTADLRTKIEARIYEPDLMEIIEAYANEKVKRDRKEFNGRHQSHSRPTTNIVYGLEGAKDNSQLAGLRVRMMLMPAILLLAKPQNLKSDDVEKAIRYARSAQYLARSTHVEEALKARCSYYIGLAAFLLLPKHALLALGRPTSIGSQSELGKPETVQAYFEEACKAKGVFEERTWAEEWVDYLKSPEVRKELSQSLEQEEQRPTSSGSWVRGWVKRLWGSKDSQQEYEGRQIVKRPPRDRLDGRRDSDASQNTDSTTRPDGPERVPSFDSWHSGDSRTTSPAMSMRQGLEDDNSTSDRLLFDGRSTDSPEPILPPPATSPNTSPTKRISFSAMSKGATASGSDTAGPSPIYQRRHSRRPSLLARFVVGRERRPSELETAEEGHSPYRGSFESVPEGGEGLKKRKGSVEPEDMV